MLNTRFDDGFSMGMARGDTMTNSEIAQKIKDLANDQMVFMVNGDGENLIAYNAGAIAGLAQRINL